MRAKAWLRSRWWIVAGAAVAIVAGLALVLVFGGGGAQRPVPVTVLGVTYTTNLEMSATNGVAYVRVPVNTEVDEAILEVENPEDRSRIREFLDGLDTFVPGEHVLELGSSELRFIVDGMAGE